MGVRLDLDNPKTVAALIDFGVDVDTFIVNGNHVDVCIMCYDDMVLEDDAEHPPYDEDVYACCCCGVRLQD